MKMERDMFRTRIEEMEKELAALRKSVGANPPAKGSALNSSMANVRPRKEKVRIRILHMRFLLYALCLSSKI